jgi:hypothetical protein
MKCPVTSFMTETPSLVDEEFGRITLVNKDSRQHQKDNLNDTGDVLCPSPT